MGVLVILERTEYEESSFLSFPTKSFKRMVGEGLELWILLTLRPKAGGRAAATWSQGPSALHIETGKWLATVALLSNPSLLPPRLLDRSWNFCKLFHHLPHQALLTNKALLRQAFLSTDFLQPGWFLKVYVRTPLRSLMVLAGVSGAVVTQRNSAEVWLIYTYALFLFTFRSPWLSWMLFTNCFLVAHLSPHFKSLDSKQGSNTCQIKNKCQTSLQVLTILHVLFRQNIPKQRVLMIE